MSDSNRDIKIGDTVVVAVDSRQNYRPDLIEVIVEDIKVSPKTTRYYLSDGSSVMSSRKIVKVN